MESRRFSFGTPATGVVWFHVLYEGDELPGWSSPVVNERLYVFPGSFPPRSETEIISVGPSLLTWRLGFESLDDYWAMLAKLGTSATLTVLKNVQSHRGTYREEHGDGYIDLPGTMLLALDEAPPELDGWIEANATFRRHIDPATGLVVPS